MSAEERQRLIRTLAEVKTSNAIMQLFNIIEDMQAKIVRLEGAVKVLNEYKNEHGLGDHR